MYTGCISKCCMHALDKHKVVHDLYLMVQPYNNIPTQTKTHYINVWVHKKVVSRQQGSRCEEADGNKGQKLKNTRPTYT